ncbi:MAG: hypothetical protein SFU98_14715 [Leptospiraceae bacterium]|nr:hypothetical protein [Leptospiraceae bacterium]
MEIQLKLIGVILILLALVHGIFPRYFDWKEELKNLSLINRQLMWVHTFFIAVTVFLIGILCLLSSNDLVNTSFGRKISLGLSAFWTLRLYFQFFVYSSELWKGKLFETVVHILFSIFWFYISLVFLLVGLG